MKTSDRWDLILGKYVPFFMAAVTHLSHFWSDFIFGNFHVRNDHKGCHQHDQHGKGGGFPELIVAEAHIVLLERYDVGGVIGTAAGQDFWNRIVGKIADGQYNS